MRRDHDRPYVPYKPTAHAEERRLEMGVSTKEVKRALNDPEITYPAGTGEHTDQVHHGERTMHLHGRVAVVVDDVSLMVVTILWRGQVFDREDPTNPGRPPRRLRLVRVG